MNLPQAGSRRAFWSLCVAPLLFVSTSVLAQLSVSPGNLHFTKVAVGQSKTITAKLTNSGSQSVTVSSVSSSLNVFAVSGLNVPFTLAAKKSVQFSVVFTPSADGYDSGTVNFNTNAATLNVSGWGTGSWGVTANPPSLSFGSVPVGSTSTLNMSLTNSGSSSITVSQEKFTAAGYSVGGLTLPLTLGAGQSFTFTISFTPSTTGGFNSYFDVTSPGFPVLAISLSGTGTSAGQLNDSPSSMNFGNVDIGNNSSQSGTLSASGASVTVTSASSSNSQFTISGVTLPVTISAGQSLPYTVTFAPQSSGSASANLSFVSNASDSNLSESLSGTGVQTQYSVALTWDASTSPVTGYNVYRGAKSGGPYTKINSALDPSTAYTDSTVSTGQTYYYVTTSVNSSGQESTYSNQVQAIIP